MTATYYALSGILRGILQEGGDSPRGLSETLSETLKIQNWEAEQILQDFLGHEIPDDYSGTVRLDGRLVILDSPKQSVYHHTVELVT